MTNTRGGTCMRVSSGVHAFMDEGYGDTCIHCGEPNPDATATPQSVPPQAATLYTPEPWTLVPGTIQRTVWSADAGQIVAGIGGRTVAEADANARLIAAAPAMRAVIQSFLDAQGDTSRFDDAFGTALNTAEVNARALLAHIDGGQS